jgi:tetratricopeptide (TPR) repeat protein
MNHLPLRRQIEILADQQLIVNIAPDEYAFRHALMREAAYTSIVRRERRLCHLAVAETLEQMPPDARQSDSQAGDLAYHYYEGGRWDKALHYAQMAGERAQRLYAPREAVAHFTRALEAAQNMGQAPPPHLCYARALSYETMGEFEAARGDYRAGLESAQATGDQAAEWQALLSLGMLWTERDYARSGERLRQALALARRLADPYMLAHSLNRVGNWHVNVDQLLEALDCHLEALAIFERLNDRPGLASTYDLLGMANTLRGDLAAGAAHYEQAIALFRELDDRHALVSSLASHPMRAATYQTDLSVTVAPLRAAACDGEAALELARSIKQRAGEAYALIFIAHSLGPAGEYARAFEAAEQGLVVAEAMDHRQWCIAAHCALGALHWDVFSMARAQQHLSRSLELAHETGSSHWINSATGHLASIYIERNELDQAAAVLAMAGARTRPAETVGQRMARFARGELALASGQPELALKLADDLAATAPNYTGPGAIPRLSRLRAEALVQLERMLEAAAELEAARATAQWQGAHSELWRIHKALQRNYQRLGRSAEADDEAANTRRLVSELAAQLPHADMRQAFERIALG